MTFFFSILPIFDQLPSPEQEQLQEPQRKKQRLDIPDLPGRRNAQQQAKARPPIRGRPARLDSNRVQPRRDTAVSDSLGEEDERNIESNPGLRPVLLRRKRYVKRRDRAVHSLETALDSRNYDPILPRTAPHEIHHIKLTADRQRNRPAREIHWTTKPPPAKRRGPEDIMSKGEKISPEAEAAETTADFWGLFFPDTILDKIVHYSNEKIAEDMAKKNYTEDQLSKKPHLKPLDKVSLIGVFFLLVDRYCTFELKIFFYRYRTSTTVSG